MGLDPLLVAGQLFSFSTLMLLVGSLTCKTVSRMTYTVMVETLNTTHSLSINIRYATILNVLKCKFYLQEDRSASIVGRFTYFQSENHDQLMVFSRQMPLFSHSCKHTQLFLHYITLHTLHYIFSVHLQNKPRTADITMSHRSY